MHLIINNNNNNTTLPEYYTAGILYWPISDLKTLDIDKPENCLCYIVDFTPDHLYISRKIEW